MYRRVGIVLLVIFCQVKSTMAQVSNTPFTQQALGDLYGTFQPTSFAMGGIGISYGDIRYINSQNPALLVYNSVYTYSAGLLAESRRTSDGVNSQKSAGANLSHLGMSFPIKPAKWISSVLLSPYSNVDYKYITIGEVGESTFETTQTGDKGLVQLEWANGFKITDNIKFGVKAKYLFGSIEKTSSNSLTGNNVNQLNVPAVFSKDVVSDFLFGMGTQYRQKVTEKTYLNLGITYDFQSKLNTKRLQTLESRNLGGIILSSDTLINNEKRTMTLPSRVGIGASIGQPLKWLIGIDVKFQEWSKFENFEGANTDIQNSFSVALGGEYTPDAGSIDNTLKRVTYRLGMSYQRTPYVVNGNGVNDFGINFGWSLPAGGISSLDMGFRIGNRGSIGSNQLDENYFQLQIGATLNDRLWFIKRKYD